jgi:hypothetical protein
LFKNLNDYQLQVKLFCEHLNQDFLAGFIIGPKESRKNRPAKLFATIEKNQNHTIWGKENLYFVPQVCDEYAGAECVTAIKTLFIDLDETDKTMTFNEHIEPNLVLRRTDGRAYQCFFFLENDISAKEFSKYQKVLSDRYHSDELKNVNRLARVAGVRRGDKSKDEKGKIESGLHYEIVSHHSKKLSNEELKILVSNKSANPPLTVHNDPLLKPGQYRNTSDQITLNGNKNQALTGRQQTLDEIFDDSDDGLGKIYPQEEAYFYACFSKENHDFESYKNITVGEGLRNALYKFACFVQERGVSLNKFRDYALKQNIDVYRISGCEDDVFDEMERAARKYAKSQKKLAEKEEHKTAKNNINKMELDALFEKYPYLDQIYHSELQNYYFVEGEDNFYRQDPGNRLTKISKNSFTITFQKYTGMRNSKGKIVKCNPINLFLSYETRHFFNITTATTYQPHAPRMVFDGSMLLNTWFYPVHNVQPTGSLDIFIKHIRWLFKDQKAIDGTALDEFFLDYLAYVYCNAKPANFAWLLYAAKMGAGRSFFTDCLQKLMGDNNVSTPTPRVAYDQYTTWHSSKQFAVVEELTSDKGFYDNLKPIIGNEKVAHREMHKNPGTVTNYCNMMLLSNKMDCLRIAEGDRRILVVHMHQELESKEYYDALYSWKDKEENIVTLAQFLIARNETVDRQKMLGHAPVTDAKLLMQQVNKDMALQNIEEYIEGSSFGENNEFVDQESLINNIYPNMQDAVRIYCKSVAVNMQKAGYVPLFTGKQLRIGKDKKRTTIFVVAKYAEKYVRKLSLRNVINAYKKYKNLPYEEEDEVKPTILVTPTESVRPAIEHIIVTLPFIIQKSEPASEIKKEEAREKVKKPASPKTEKVHALVAEARRRHEEKQKAQDTPVVVKRPPCVEDLIEIRTRRMSQKVDVSFLYH